MSIASIKEIAEGATITFRSKNPADTTSWKGVLESIGTYRSIQRLMDPRAYNEAVRQSDPSISSDIEKLTYFTITVDNGSDVPSTQVFANEWIKAGTLYQLVLGNKVTIEVDDPNNDAQAIVSLLAGQGYPCRIIPNK